MFFSFIQLELLLSLIYNYYRSMMGMTMKEEKKVEEVYIYNKEKVIGIAKIYNKPHIPFRFYDVDDFCKIKNKVL